MVRLGNHMLIGRRPKCLIPSRAASPDGDGAESADSFMPVCGRRPMDFQAAIYRERKRRFGLDVVMDAIGAALHATAVVAFSSHEPMGYLSGAQNAALPRGQGWCMYIIFK